jgi:hypothetical protein
VESREYLRQERDLGEVRGEREMRIMEEGEQTKWSFVLFFQKIHPYEKTIHSDIKESRMII